MQRTSLPDFRGQVRAVNRVERLLRRVTAALSAARIPYAVAGGNDVAAWVATVDEGAVRATKDVDILVRRDDLERIAQHLHKLGLMPVEVLGVTMFADRRRPNPKTGVRAVFAGEKIRPHYAYPAPDPAQSVVSTAGDRVITLPELLGMKLQAYRFIDRAHVVDLMAVGLIPRKVRTLLPPDLRKRLREVEREAN